MSGSSNLDSFRDGRQVAGQKQDDQLEHTFRIYVRIRDVALKTCQRQWTIGRSGERGHDNDVVL